MEINVPVSQSCADNTTSNVSGETWNTIPIDCVAYDTAIRKRLVTGFSVSRVAFQPMNQEIYVLKPYLIAAPNCL